MALLTSERFPARPAISPSTLGLIYAWSGVLAMWAFWACFVVFLASPARWASYWPLPTIDQGKAIQPVLAALLDTLLIALFGLQHSLMARPWFKAWWARTIPPAFERCTFVHSANVALFALILFWQPVPTVLWEVRETFLRDLLWAAFALGWITLFAGATSFGLGELLGLDQMRSWARNRSVQDTPLKTGRLYRWIRHPMYVGVLLGVWATPRMTMGHALLAMGFTVYVLIAMRYEERDLARRYGSAYGRWRRSALTTRASSAEPRKAATV